MAMACYSAGQLTDPFPIGKFAISTVKVTTVSPLAFAGVCYHDAEANELELGLSLEPTHHRTFAYRLSPDANIGVLECVQFQPVFRILFYKFGLLYAAGCAKSSRGFRRVLEGLSKCLRTLQLLTLKQFCELPHPASDGVNEAGNNLIVSVVLGVKRFTGRPEEFECQ